MKPWIPGQSPTSNQRMPVIGLLGGVACGKSLVASQLASLGAAVIDADRIGHQVLEIPEVRDAVRERWGEGVFDPNGMVNRRALGAIVFAKGENGQEERRHLEQLVHPRIGEIMMRQAAEAAGQNRPALVLDAPAMVESQWDTLCDLVLFIDAPREVRLLRARQRGWTDEEFAAREAAQESVELKRSRADAVIDNSGSIADTLRQVNEFWKQNVE